MAIDPNIYGRINTDFGQQLGQIFDPNLNTERQNRLAQLANHDAMQQMNMLQAVNELKRAPVLQQRQDAEYVQKVAEHQIALAEAKIKRDALAELNNPATQEPRRMQLYGFLFPEKAAEQAFKPPAVGDSNQPFNPDGSPNTAFQKYEQDKARFTAGLKQQDENVNWQTIQTENGYAQVNPKTGEIRQLGVSKPTNPLVEMKLQEAKNEKEKSRNQQSLSAQQVLDQAATLYAHPGRKMGTGMSSFMSAVPGTDARGFKANLDTFKAQTFVPMVSALKGMGALSDAEGKKLSESVGALDPGMPEDEFAKSLQGITAYLYNKAKAAGLNVAMPEFAGVQGQATQQPASGWGIERVK